MKCWRNNQALASCKSSICCPAALAHCCPLQTGWAPSPCNLLTRTGNCSYFSSMCTVYDSSHPACWIFLPKPTALYSCSSGYFFPVGPENIQLFSPGTKSTTSPPAALKESLEALLTPYKKQQISFPTTSAWGALQLRALFSLRYFNLQKPIKSGGVLCAFHPSLACLHPCHPSGLCCWHQTNHSCGALAKLVWKTVSAQPVISSQCLQCLCGNNFAAGRGSAFL